MLKIKAKTSRIKDISDEYPEIDKYSEIMDSDEYPKIDEYSDIINTRGELREIYTKLEILQDLYKDLKNTYNEIYGECISMLKMFDEYTNEEERHSDIFRYLSGYMYILSLVSSEDEFKLLLTSKKDIRDLHIDIKKYNFYVTVLLYFGAILKTYIVDDSDENGNFRYIIEFRKKNVDLEIKNLINIDQNNIDDIFQLLIDNNIINKNNKDEFYIIDRYPNWFELYDIFEKTQNKRYNSEEKSDIKIECNKNNFRKFK